MAHRTGIQLLLTFALSFSMLLAGMHTAFGSPSMPGDQWSISAGWEVEVGMGRDPGDRDGKMAGIAAGPSLGAQYWLEDWLAAEALLVHQTDHVANGPFAYESSAWRVAAGFRLAAPTALSPHLSLGVGYDHFQSEWSALSADAEPNGRGIDRLNSLVGISELGLTLHGAGWSLGAHLGFVMYFGADAEATVTAWPADNMGQAGHSRSSVTDWASGPMDGGNINAGVRLTRSF